MNILFVCSVNEERSPTAEILFRDLPGWNVKSAGTEPNAANKISPELVEWADKIIAMEDHHHEKIVKQAPNSSSKIMVLGIEDNYYRFSPELVGRLIIEMSKRFQLDAWIKSKFQL